MPETAPSQRRLVVTAFDAQYFRQGLNLIASLHRTSLHTVDRILVYSVGLTDTQRARLRLLERVDVLDFPSETETFYPEYLHPKSHAYKCAAIKFAADHVADGGLVLWMDAGIAALQPVDEIYAHIARDGVFFVDHSDSGFWPFYNLMFTHPRSLEHMQATNRERLGLHLCSCILGYRKNGAHQRLIDEAYAYSQNPEIVLWPKHRGAADNEVPVLSAWQRFHKWAVLRFPFLADRTSPETLRTLFGYYGHTGDQPIYSVLSARYGCRLHPAPRYNRSNRLSEQASKLNWHSGGESDALLRSRYNLEKVDEDVVIYHHRGTYDNLDGLRFKHRRSDTVVVCGAGFPESLSSKIDILSVGQSPDDLADWSRMPTYYAWLEPPKSSAQTTSIYKLVQEQAGRGIELFFLHPALLDAYPDLADAPRVLCPHRCTLAFSLLDRPSAPAPVLAVQCALLLGYRDVILTGLPPTPDAPWTTLDDRLATFPARIRQAEDDEIRLPFPPAPLADLDAKTPRPPEPDERAYWRARVLDGLPLTPSFSRSKHAQFDEIGFVHRILEDQVSPETGTMIDVGACRGRSLIPFAEAGWRVLAFEPDPKNRIALEHQVKFYSTVTVDPRAVGDQVQEDVPFYISEESEGASSLLAFTDAHAPADPVTVTTLNQVLQAHTWNQVTLLKIDAEGYDLPILRGFPWDRSRPEVVVCEFEDRKTEQIGYTFHDLAEFLQAKDYHVLVSEWHPIVRYGVRHDWHRLARYPYRLHYSEAWGNLIAFANPPEAEPLRTIAQEMIGLPAPPPSFSLQRLGRKLRGRLRRWLR